MRIQWILLPTFVIVLAGVVAYMGYLWTRSDGDTLRGWVAVYSHDPTRPYTGGGCTATDEGPGEFADLKRGTPVSVKDEAGNLLAIVELSKGSTTLDTCTFAFVAGPLSSASSYTIQVGERPPATLTHEELLARRWQIRFDFGGQPAAQ